MAGENINTNIAAVLKEFYESAEENFRKNRFTAAARDYAKAIFLMIDEYLRKKYGITVKDDYERKTILLSKSTEDEKCKKLLEILKICEKVYNEETYIRHLTKEEALALKTLAEDVRKLIE